ncbi:MAG TPA: hypothetical protein DDW55_10105 [Gammaproteobacteria bacterium]|nr:hypothetical protein [Gammaproteobacteria bacterium]
MQIRKIGIGILLTVALLSSAIVHAKPPGTASNDNLPFCPCFSTSEIDNGYANQDVTECIDDRAFFGIGDDLARTIISFLGGGDVEVYSADGGASWLCYMTGAEIGPLVGFNDIGFTNAMACRQTVVNSQTWTRCP